MKARHIVAFGFENLFRDFCRLGVNVESEHQQNVDVRKSLVDLAHLHDRQVAIHHEITVVFAGQSDVDAQLAGQGSGFMPGLNLGRTVRIVRGAFLSERQRVNRSRSWR